MADTSRAKDIGKSLSTHYLNDGTTADTSSVAPSETTYNYDYGSLTRVGISVLATTKVFNSPVYQHKLYDNTTVDTDTVSLGDAAPTFGIEKALNTHYLYEGATADTNSVTMSDTTGSAGTRTVPFFVLNKQLATHYLYDGSTADTSSVTMTGSGGSLWLSPYTDPYPTNSSYFANDSGNYTTGESSFTG